VKCSDISDRAVLEFLSLHQGHWETHGDRSERTSEWSRIPTVSDAMPPGTPFKLQLAKMRQLHRREFVGGCTCGCRGDWEITDKGLAFIGQPRTTPYNGY
jgi:hypothetical protein